MTICAATAGTSHRRTPTVSEKNGRRAATDPGKPFKYLIGDVNLDDSINMKKLTCFERHLNGYSENEYMEKELGDTFKDSAIDIKDITRLQRYINGWDVKQG